MIKALAIYQIIDKDNFISGLDNNSQLIED